SGGVELRLADLLDEPLMKATARVTLEMDFERRVFELTFSGQLSIYKLGAVGATAGRFVLDLSYTLSDSPQFWGVATLQTNFEELEQYGLFILGNGTLQINTTDFVRTETLTLPGIGPNNTDLTRTYQLAPKTFAIEIVGGLRVRPPGAESDLFRMEGGFFLKINPQRFEVFATASLSYGIGAAQITYGEATGLLVVVTQPTRPGEIPGVAGSFKVSSSAGIGIPNVGDLFSIEGSVTVSFNTTLADQTFTIPEAFLPLLKPGDPTSINVFGSEPGLDGRKVPGSLPAVYFVVSIQAELTIQRFITLTGFIQISVAGNTGGVLSLKVTGAVGADIPLLGALSGSLNFNAYIGTNPADTGIVGRIHLVLVSNRIPGVQFDGEFLLEINTFSTGRTIQTFVIDETTGRFMREANGRLKVGNVTLDPGPGAVLMLGGRLIVGNTLTLEGTFTFVINPTRLEVNARAMLRLDPIGQVMVMGDLRIDSEGLVARVNLSLDLSFGRNIGLEFEASALLEINTTGREQMFESDPTPIAAGLRIRITGSVNFLGFARGSGSVEIIINNSGMQIMFHVGFNIGGLSFRADGLAAVYAGANPGLVMDLAVSARADVSVFLIEASGRLKLNTTGITRNNVAPGFVLAVNGTVDILKVLKFDAGFDIIVRDNYWRFGFNANIDFFSLVELQGSGYLDSRGNFDISLRGEFVLGTRSFGLIGEFHFRLVSEYLTDNTGNPYYRFILSGGAAVEARVFGITLAGVGLSFEFRAEGAGRVEIELSVTVQIKILFVKVSKTASFTIGYLELPRPVYLAGNRNGDPRAWSGGELNLNMGDRGYARNLAGDATDESYIIEQVGGTANDATIQVTAMGRSRTYEHVTSIRGLAGSGNDTIIVKPGVSVPVFLDGGSGDDVIVYEGNGGGTFHGGEGEDYIQTAGGNVVVDGGADGDFILHEGSLAALLIGGAGNDRIIGGSGADQIFGDDQAGLLGGDDDITGGGGADVITTGAGNDLVNLAFNGFGSVITDGSGNDLLWITGTSSADNIVIKPGVVNGQVMLLSGGGTITGNGLEQLRVDAGTGSDSITVENLANSGVTSLTFDLGRRAAVVGTTLDEDGQVVPIFAYSNDGGTDTVRIVGTEQADIFQASTGADGDGVARVQVIQGTRQFNLYSSVRSENDTLILDSLGGNDTIDAGGMTGSDRMALKVAAGSGDDRVIGSDFNDVLDSGAGNDTLTGGRGLDTFIDESGVDTLVENQDADMALFDNLFVVGALQPGQTNRYDALATTVEDLGGRFEFARLTGGSAGNAISVGDRENRIVVGNVSLSGRPWDSGDVLGGAGSGGGTPVIIVDDGGGGSDRLNVVTPLPRTSISGAMDTFVLNGITYRRVVFDALPDYVLFRNQEEVTITLGLASDSFTIEDTHTGLTTLNALGGNDVIAVQRISGPTAINAGDGDDEVHVSDQVVVVETSPNVFNFLNTTGTANNIVASLTINGDGGDDTVTIDDSTDAAANTGVLTATSLSGIFGTGGSLTYGTLETLNINLGTGGDTMNVRSTANTTNIRTHGGNDTVTVGSTAGGVFGDGTLNGISGGRLTVWAGNDPNDILNVDDGGETNANSGRLTSIRFTGFGMTLGIEYHDFEMLEIKLGEGADTLYLESTHARATQISTGAGNDTVNVNRINGETKLLAGAGQDTIRVNYDQDGRQTFEDGVDSTLGLYGGADDDLYEIGLSGEGEARILVDELNQGGPSGSQANVLKIYGTNAGDFFLFRPGLVAAIEVDANRQPVPNGVVERVRYQGEIAGGIQIYGRDGDDTFVLDDVLSTLVLFGDAGNDTFQIGQVFQSPRDATNPFNGLTSDVFFGERFVAETFSNHFETTLTTRGYLSNGVSRSTTIFGGIGNDSFTVYRNKAELFLFGDEDDDSFRVRAFVKVNPNDPKAPFTNINGGQGADFISFTVNAPVRIEGGDGFDSLTVVGTEFGDDFVVSDQGVFGAGLFVTYGGIEKLIVDALEGNDRFYILSTPEGAVVELIGGRGSDTFNVGGGNGGQPITVVSRSLEGHSGLIDHTLLSSALDYNNLFAQDLSVKVADNDAAGVAIQMVQPLRVFESPLAPVGLVQATYLIVLTRSPEENVRITAAPAPPRERDQRAGGQGILLNGSASGVTLLFDRRNWFIPQMITITAPNDALAEGRQFINIQHSVVQGGASDDGGAYDRLAIPGVVAEVIDDDAADVLIARTGQNTQVSEGGAVPSLATDTYSVVLTKQPTGNVTIHLFTDGQVQTSVATLTFTPANWNVAQVVTVTAANDASREGIHYSRITHKIAGVTDAATFDPVRASAYYGVARPDVVHGLAGAVNGDLEGTVSAGVIADGACLTVAGQVLPGLAWRLRLDGVEYAYFAVEGDTLEDVAVGLGALIDGTSEFAATVSGLEIEITRADAAAFAVAFVGTGDLELVNPRLRLSGPAFTLVPSANVSMTASTPAWTESTLTLAGAVSTGVMWKLRLNGVEFIYTTETTDLDLAAIAVGLADVVNSAMGGAFSATPDGDTVVIQAGGQSFTAEIVREAVDGTVSSGGSFAGTLSTTHYAQIELTFTVAANVVPGTAWELVLNGRTYRYVAGSNRDVTRPASLDVRIADDDTPGVLVTESNGSTRVIEPSNFVVLGSGFVSQQTAPRLVLLLGGTVTPGSVWTVSLRDNTSGGVVGTVSYSARTGDTLAVVGREVARLLDAVAGFSAGQQAFTTTAGDRVVLWISRDTGTVDFTVQYTIPMGGSATNSGFVSGFIGDFGTSIVRDTGVHDSVYTAQNIDLGKWSKGVNPNIVSATTIPHLTILGTSLGNGETDFYKFTITQEMLDDDPAIRAIFDIDHGFELGDSLLWGSRLRLYDVIPDPNATGSTVARLLAQGAGVSSPVVGAGGSSTWLDDYLEYTFITPGTYYIEVDNWIGFGGLPEGIDYELQVSIEQHPVDAFIFAPEPTPEDETGNNTIVDAQDLDPVANPGLNFFTFFDPNVGGGVLDFLTPYARIQGAGDGSFDIFEFEITDAMLNPNAIQTILDTPLAGPFFTQITLDLTGPVSVGDVFTLTLRGRDFVYTALPGDQADEVAAGLEQLLRTQAPGRYSTAISGNALTISDPYGFTFGGLRQQVAAPGTITRTTTPVEQGTNTPIRFSSATVALANAGALVAGERWSVSLTDTSATPVTETFFYDVQAGDTIGDVMAALLDEVNRAANYIASGTPNASNPASFTITRADGGLFAVRVSLQSLNPRGTATITGTPDPTQGPAVNWASALFAAPTPQVSGEVWTLTINGTAYEFTTGGTLTLGAVQNGLNADIPASEPYTVAVNGTMLEVTTTGDYFTATLTVTPPVVDYSPNTRLITLSGPVVADDVWAIVLDGTPRQYTVLATDDSLEDIAAGLVTELNGDTDYLAVAEGGSIRITRLTAGSVSVSSPTRSFTSGAVGGAAVTTVLVTLGGTRNLGETWRITLDGTNYDFVVTASETNLTMVAAQLAKKVNDTAPGYTAAASGQVIAIVKLDGTAITISLTPPTGDTMNQAAATATEVVVLSGSTITGDTWAATLAGNDREFTVGGTQTLAAAATGLAEQLALDTAYAVAAKDGTITITRIAGGAIAVTAPTRETAAGATTVSTLTTKGFVLGGSVTKGETWVLELDEAGPFDHVVADGEDLVDVVTALAGAVNLAGAGYTAVLRGTTLIITRTDGTNFTPGVTIAPVASGEAYSFYDQVIRFVTGYTARPLDQWSFVLGTTPLVSTASTNALILDDFVSQIDGRTIVGAGGANPLSAFRTGTDTLTIRGSRGVTVTVNSLALQRGVAAQMTTADTRPHYDEVTLTLTGAFVSRETWIVTLDGEIFRYDVPPAADVSPQNRDLEFIARNLTTLINASARFNATRNGAAITVTTEEPNDPFLVEVSRGGGRVEGVFDIDRSTLVQGVSRIPFLDFLGFGTSNAFTTSLVLELLDESGNVLGRDWIYEPGRSNAIDAGS
ncbi:MAG TPA: calcium-binding protein, partial [Methylomirabilota bacterium]|nr:calcium-binding protein [Methylomirabilota bacterium]